MNGQRKAGREPNLNFAWGLWRFFVGSGVVTALALVAVAVMGLNFGIDFAGGHELQVKLPPEAGETSIRAALAPLGLSDANVQRFGIAADHEHLILVPEQEAIPDDTKTAIRTELEGLAGGPDGLTNWAVAQNGESITAGFTKPVTEEQVRGVLGKHNLKIKRVSRGEREDRPDYSIQLVSFVDDVDKALRAHFKVADDVPIIQRNEFVGPQVGAHLRNQGIMAVVYALVFMLLYVGIRFDLLFAPGAVLALFHDLIITLGVFAIFQIEFNLGAIAALLTITGYSINDTIVVYDRIRENIGKMRGRDLRSMVNMSINQTLSRTMLTGGTTLLTLITLAIFGGGVISGFCIALIVGIISGTYSSFALAVPMFIVLKERGQKQEEMTDSRPAAATGTTHG